MWAKNKKKLKKIKKIDKFKFGEGGGPRGRGETRGTGPERWVTPASRETTDNTDREHDGQQGATGKAMIWQSLPSLLDGQSVLRISRTFIIHAAFPYDLYLQVYQGTLAPSPPRRRTCKYLLYEASSVHCNLDFEAELIRAKFKG